ncbi:MAG: DUF1211 domain-containing protein [Candidatus Eremiobacteraeota bacterium]|nr:DUF1211 domain-containing protein [Candidatus Eremiobacteraeota bacterium]MBV9647274.1 DUF1211 domain-containing protein [Candidatus Eremiobacteraeota bacterium]
MRHPDKAEHTIHRLEAFSDIVIGFCLAQLGLGLVLPKNSTDTFSVWASTTLFITAFIFIAVLWWLHHRTFSSFFVLNTPMIVINFGILCGLILTLYFANSVVRIFALGQNSAVFFALFLFSFALVYVLVGLMLLVGLFLRRSEMPRDEIRWATNKITSIVMAVAFGVTAGTLAITNPHGTHMRYAVVAALIAIVVASRLLLPRWLNRIGLGANDSASGERPLRHPQ